MVAQSAQLQEPSDPIGRLALPNLKFKREKLLLESYQVRSLRHTGG